VSKLSQKEDFFELPVPISFISIYKGNANILAEKFAVLKT
jgi:hypothetical protein